MEFVQKYGIYGLGFFAQSLFGARLIVQLTGLPPVVAVLLGRVALGWIEYEEWTGLPVGEMVALYRDLGFVEIPPYGPDLDGEIAFFEKRLSE